MHRPPVRILTAFAVPACLAACVLASLAVAEPAATAAAKGSDPQARPAMLRRLNRREYVNSIRDFFGIETNGQGLPADAAGKPYDTFGGTAAVSAEEAKQYLAVARGVVAEAIAEMKLEAQPSVKRIVRVEPERESPRREEIAAHEAVVNAYQRRMLDLERWRRAGESPKFLPLGLASVEAAKQAVEAARKPDEKYLEAAAHLSRPRAAEGWYLHPAPRGEADDGSQFATQYPRITLPADLPAGVYVVRVRAGRAVERIAAPNGGVNYSLPSPRLAFIELCSARPRQEPNQGNAFRSGPTEIAVVDYADVTGGTWIHGPPPIIEFPITVRPGSPGHYFVREKAHADPRSDAFRTAEELRANGIGPTPSIWIDWIECEGPLQRPQVAARLRSLLGLPAPQPVPAPPGQPKPEDPRPEVPKEADPAAVKSILERFVTRAFRGAKPEASFIDRLLEVQQARLKAGDDLLGSLVEPLAIVLAAPEFLFIQGPAQPPPAPPAAGAPAAPPPAVAKDVPPDRLLPAAELAARLSYFICGGPPDDQLIASVQSAAIRDVNQLAAQATRLAQQDPRAAGFAEAFTRQWLSLDELDRRRFDFRLYPTFDESARKAAKEEVWQTFHTVLKENLDARRLLKSDFVVVNSVLGDHYGFPVEEPGVRAPLTGRAFRKVPVSGDSPRGGLVGMAGVLAIGSDGRSSSPVKRGAWVLRHLLADPPPPAPPNVPPLSRLDDKPLTIRQRLAAHEQQAQCSQCHKGIDPVGFGLENFDAAGQWREFDTLKPGDLVRRNPVTGRLLAADLKGTIDPDDPKNGVVYRIDPSGALAGGQSFTNYFQFRDVVAAQGDDFLRGLIENLYEYALGRPRTAEDAEAIEGLVTAAKTDGGGLTKIVSRIVTTPEFRSR